LPERIADKMKAMRKVTDKNCEICTEEFERFKSFHELFTQFTNEHDDLPCEKYDQLSEYVDDFETIMVPIAQKIGIDLSKHSDTIGQILENGGYWPDPYHIEGISFPGEESGEAACDHVHEKECRLEAWKEAIADLDRVMVCLFQQTTLWRRYISQGKDYVFHKEGHFWIIAFQGSCTFIKHTNGMSYILRLLEKPHQSITVMQLTNSEISAQIEPQKFIEPDPDSAGPGEPQELADRTYLVDCQKRLGEIEEQMYEAKKNYDLAMQERLEEEKKQILGLLESIQKPGGSSRYFNSEIEKARKAVSIAITRALESIKKENLALYLHLRNSIQCGRYCVYAPDRDTPWEF
jgi:hypothetical protein